MYFCERNSNFARNVSHKLVNTEKHITMKKNLTLMLICFVTGTLSAQVDANYQAYIEKYAELAVTEQKRHAIPASITMAQALLESSAGTSRLATLGNNHFGIKCGKDWTGDVVHHDDDQLGECFRKYKKPIESFEDHSLFLKRQRYAFLFQYEITDYKSWAYGLSRAGYATDPAYPEKLIKIIETYDLAKLDTQTKTVEPEDDTPNYEQLWGYIEIENNGVRCVRVITKDKVSKVAKAFKMSEKRLLYYNDLMPNMDVLQAGDYVYLWFKKNRAHSRFETHTIEAGESMHSISQLYGIKLKKLYKLNNLEYGTPAEVGKVLKLQ